MVRRYSVAQSDSGPNEPGVLANVGPPSGGPPWTRLRRFSEGQYTRTRAHKLPPIRAIAATVLQRTLASPESTPSTNRQQDLPSLFEDERPSPSNWGPSHRVRLAPNMDPTRSLLFIPFEFDIYEQGPCVHVGRFADRRNNTETTNAATHDEAHIAPEATSIQAATHSNVHDGRTIAALISDDQTRITFKSKVVSRIHAELKCEAGGKIFLRDTRSSSGTFLNQTRLSSPGVLSKYHEVVDGDLLQFGIDYQGGVQEIFRCIKLRIEIDKECRLKPSQFSHNMFRAVQERGSEQGLGGIYSSSAPQAHAKDAQPSEKSQNIAECCICLFKITVCQALFIAPCSHAFHYKCIRPLLQLHHPGFMCPLCRTFSNLEEDVDDDDEHVQDFGQQCCDSITNNEEFSEGEMFAAASSQLHLGPANPSCPSSTFLPI